MGFPSLYVCIKGQRHGFPISVKGWGITTVEEMRKFAGGLVLER